MREIIIDGVPKAVQSFRFTRRGFRYQPKDVVSWKNFVKLQCMAQLPDDFTTIEGPVMVDMKFVFPPLKSWPKRKLKQLDEGVTFHKTTRPDCDNLLKATLDSLSGIVWKDDSQIVELKMVKVYGREPMTVFRVYPVLGEV